MSKEVNFKQTGALLSPSQPTIRLLIADDYIPLRQALSWVLNSIPGFEVVGEANEGYEAIELYRQLKPQVVLMDLQMPRLDGVAAIRTIRRDDPPCRIIAMPVFTSDELLFEGLQVGAVTYVLKGGSLDELCHTVRRVSRFSQVLV